MPRLTTSSSRCGWRTRRSAASTCSLVSSFMVDPSTAATDIHGSPSGSSAAACPDGERPPPCRRHSQGMFVMPWNSQGGGGWQGGGGPGPWGGRPGGGQQPPDLEELLRRSQEKVKSLFPGGGPAERRPQGPGRWSASPSWACGWPAASTPSSRTSRVWSRASASSTASAAPGLKYHLPTPIEAVEKVPVTRVNRVEVGFRSAGQPTAGARRRAPRATSPTRR